LNRLVGDMLVLSRLESGLPPERQPVDLAEVVGSALQNLEPMLAAFPVSVSVSGDLPNILGDEPQLELLIVNLLANAADWTKPGGRIEVGAAVRHAGVALWVENEGPHIRPVDLDRVFDKFWTRRAHGSGLGLAICKRVVEAHGGAIRAENRRGGPRFTFTLPAVERVTTA
jgi:two-component system sensor histidine kinase KdpD